MKENKTTTINYESVKNALATIDKRFVVADDIAENTDADKVVNYCSIRKVLADNSIDTKRVFSIYYNANSVTIHCAKRFSNVCSESYHLNKKQTEYTHNVKLEELAECVHALLTDECERLKMSKYTQNVQKKTTVRKASTAKKKNA